MICNNGSVKILDFGGARDYIFSNEKSLSIMLKPGYAPEEQYRTHGNQCHGRCVADATMYRCITGSVPPESLERAYQESLPPIRSISPDCPPAAASAIEKGMSISDPKTDFSLCRNYTQRFMNHHKAFRMRLNPKSVQNAKV